MNRKLNQLQKLRLIQAFIAFLVMATAYVLVGTFAIPDSPPLDAFLTPSEIIRYNVIQLIFLIAFVGWAGLLGMAYQAKDITQEEK